MAAAIVILLAVDTFFSGMLYVRSRQYRALLDEHTEVINELVEVVREHEHALTQHQRDLHGTVRDDG